MTGRRWLNRLPDLLKGLMETSDLAWQKMVRLEHNPSSGVRVVAARWVS